MIKAIAHRCACAALIAVAIALPAQSPARAQASAPAAECEKLQRAIAQERRAIEAARKVLSPIEASCAFADFSLPATGHCAGVMEAAQADPAKRRAWNEALVAWSRLERLMLAVRRLEDRRGSTCAP
jgi:hypothetical protein